MLQTPSTETKALLDLADYLERLDPKDYDQTQFTNCICGHCNRKSYRVYSDVHAARRELGLTEDIANRLFSGSAGRHSVHIMGLFSHTHLPTNKDAAKVLRHIAVTGDLPTNW